MLKSLVKALEFARCKRKQSVGLVVGLAFSQAAFSLGMGGISVITALGEPLKADIELVAVTNAEKSNLSARLASPEVFKSAGIDYPSSIPALKFKIETRAEGGKYIRVTSSEPLNEPFVSILVELSWPSGKLLREYTFLLDPPGFKPEVVKEAEVQPVAPTVAAPETKPAEAPVEGGAVAATAAVQEKAPGTPAPSGKAVAAAAAVSGEVKVNSGDSLAKIAKKVKPADISLERMLVALYRANANVFDGGNMNRLKSGKILRMPGQSDLNSLTQADAISEIHAQAADWNAYRQKLATASVAAPERAPKQEASGKISTTVADKTPAAKETAKEVVRLSKGAAPGEKIATAGSASSLQDKAHKEEETIARSKELKESKERIALLEKNAQAMQRLIELKSKSAAKPEAAQPEAKQEAAPGAAKSVAKPQGSAPAASVASAAAPAGAAASAVQPAAPKKRVVKPAQPTPAPQPSLVDEILGEPLYLAGGAAGLLALGGLGIALARRRRAGTPASEAFAQVGSTSGQILAPAAPSPETGDFTGAAVTAGVAKAAQQDEVDPISEAELFLNFGRDGQAEEILKDALDRNPANLPVMLKLMSIYANRKDVDSFTSCAQQVKNSGDKAAWAQAAEMGRKLEPDNSIYGDEGGETVIEAPVEAASGEQPASPVVDFDLGLGEVAAVQGTEPAEKAAMAPQVDFDLGLEAAPAQAGEDTVVMQPAELDETHAASAEATEMHEIGSGEAATMLDFDITSTHPSSPVAEVEETSAAMVEPAETMGDVTMIHPSLSGEIQEEAAAPASGVAAKESAYALDFSLEEEPAPATAQTETRKTPAIDLSNISLDLGAPMAAEVSGEARDANWHDIATKLDLAKAYQEMGDAAGAREILEEVLREGDMQQRGTAETMLKQLPG